MRGPQAALPGVFLPSRRWGLLIRDGADILCAYKVACTSGTEVCPDELVNDAIGASRDLWGAYGESAVNRYVQPWLGYVLLAARPGGKGALRRRRESAPESFCRRLVRERLYDAAALLVTEPAGSCFQPAGDLRLHRLCRALVARVSVYSNS